MAAPTAREAGSAVLRSFQRWSCAQQGSTGAPQLDGLPLAVSTSSCWQGLLWLAVLQPNSSLQLKQLPHASRNAANK